MMGGEDDLLPLHLPPPCLPPHRYLKISISDFLTLFSARTRRPFWERGLGKALGIAACFALGTSTIFALFWGDFIIVKSDPMASLRHSKGAILATWMYCVLWWIAQDCVKVRGGEDRALAPPSLSTLTSPPPLLLQVGAYWLIDHVFKSEDQKNIENFARNHSLEYLPPAHVASGEPPPSLPLEYLPPPPPPPPPRAAGHAAAVAPVGAESIAIEEEAPTPHHAMAAELSLGRRLPNGTDLAAVAQAASEQQRHLAGGTSAAT